jgi:hypothetical protein
MICAPGVIFGGTEGVGSSFHVLRSRTRVRRYRGRQILFSCFALPDSFSAVPRVSVEFSCSVLLDSFFAVPSASCRFFMFYPTKLIFSCTKGVGSRFHDCASELVFGSTEGLGCHFHVLRCRSQFRLYRGHQIEFSCFALPDSFSTVARVSGPVFMFCSPGLIFGGSEGVGSRFHVLRSRTHFRRYRGRRVQFSCFALPDSFSAVPWASGPVFMFCAPGLVFGCTVGVGSSFHVLRYRTYFRRY